MIDNRKIHNSSLEKVKIINKEEKLKALRCTDEIPIFHIRRKFISRINNVFVAPTVFYRDAKVVKILDDEW